MNTLAIPAGFRRSALAMAVAGLYLLPAVGSQASAPGPVGGEFAISADIFDNQFRPAIAVDAAGDFVVAWQDDSGDGGNILARRYNAAGVAQGARTGVNTITALAQTDPAIASDAAGNFVVVWTTQFTATDTDIHAQRYAANGQALGSEFTVASLTSNESTPSVAMDANGNFVVAWTRDNAGNTDILAQRYNAAGAVQGAQFQVNITTTASQINPAVAVSANGEFVIVWQSNDTGNYDIRALRYDAAGNAEQGLETIVNTVTTGTQELPAVAADAAGNFVVTWQSNASGSEEIRAQRFSFAGIRLGGEFAVSGATAGVQSTRPAVALDADGDFVVAWQKYFSDNSSEILARRYDAAGVIQGNEILVNSTPDQVFLNAPATALDADGDFTVAWVSQQFGRPNIHAQRFQGPNSVDVDLFQSDSADPAPVGSPLTYTLSAGNLQSPSALTGINAIDDAIGLATGLHIVDTLPAGSTGVSAIGTNWTCTFPSGKVACDYALPLKAAEEASALSVTITPPNTPGAVLSNVGRASADQFDDNLLNNRQVERTQLACGESVIELSASAYTVSEGTANATITATRSGGACGVASVQYDTAGSSATPGLDFTDVTGTLTWADGDLANKTFTVPIINDGLDENDERVQVSLSSARGASLGTRNTARLTITDDDASPRINFSSSSQSVPENVGLVTVTARLGVPSGRDVTVPLSFAGTASNGSDYFPGGNTLTIAAGQMQASVDIEIVSDSVDEPDETLIVGMGAVSGATVGSISTDTITIIDDDVAAVPTVSFDVASASLSEAKASTVRVTLSAASTQTVTVPYTVTGTATPATDYSLSLPSPISFSPGETAKSMVITPVDDTLHESDETVVLTMGTPTNATLGTIPAHQRTIKDNDP